MSHCINPICHRAANKGDYCDSCGTELILNHRYRVLKPLTNSEAAASGFGYIYEIIEGAQSKILKVLLSTHSNDAKAIALFQQEAEVLKKLNGQGIPKIDGYFVHKTKNGVSLHCIVMEKIDGVTLEQWMHQQGNERISEEKALNWLEEIVKILALVHQQNYFHRDIKPDNIMLHRKAGLVLIDFGTARDMTVTYLAKLKDGRITSITSAGFTPPEQMQYQAVPQSDFYALGRTFVRLLTAKQPTEIYDSVRDDFPWRKYTKNISPAVLDLIDKMMARAPIGRHQNTAELLKDIANVRKKLQVQTPVKTPTRPYKFTRRDLLLLSGLGLGAVAIPAYLTQPKSPPNVINSPPSPPIPVAETPRSTQNEPTPPSPTPTPVSLLKTQTLNNIITVDTTGKETNRRTVQVQYFPEDKIALPSGAKAIEMALIPAGGFKMGMPPQERQIALDNALKYGASRETIEKYLDASTPTQNISFAKDFYVSRYAVTQSQWFAVMGTDYDKDGFKERFSKLDNKFKGDNRPIVVVNWNDAKAYCAKLSEKTGRSYRLPTESEWEYSCRAKTTTPFYFGETITPDLVNYDGNYPYANVAKGTYRQVTTDVGSFPPNEWGLYDTHGNVYEWCEDVWHDNYNGIPQDGSAWLNGGEQAQRLLRGGSWINYAFYCRSAYRFRFSTANASYIIGFRVVASVLS